jgi:hypothetical protein
MLMHAHRPDIDQSFAGLAEALRAVGPSQAVFYNDIVLAGLPPDSRARWRAFMTTAAGSRYFSEEFQQAEAKGLAEGMATAVLTLLEGRNIAVPETVRDRILGSTDQDQLRIWLLRAATAITVDEVVAE